MKKRNVIAKDLRSQKYKPRVVGSKKKKIKEKIARRELRQQLSPPAFYSPEADIAPLQF